jgi:hypothetical protein
MATGRKGFEDEALESYASDGNGQHRQRWAPTIRQQGVFGMMSDMPGAA